MHRMGKRHIALTILLLASLIVLVFYYDDIYSLFADRQRIIDWLAACGPLSVVLFIVLQVLQVVVAPIPGEVTGVVGGYLYGPLMGTIYSTIGLTVGSVLAFGLSHFFGEPLVEKIIKKETLEKYDHFIEHKGLMLAFVCFVIPGFPKDVLCYILGLSHICLMPFLSVCLAGRLIGTIGLSVFGAILNDGCATSSTMVVILIFIALILAGLYLFRKPLMGLFHHKTQNQ